MNQKELLDLIIIGIYFIALFAGLEIWFKAFQLVLNSEWKKQEIRLAWLCMLIFIPFTCVLLLSMKNDFIVDGAEVLRN